MADEYQVIDDPNDPRLQNTPLNDEFDPSAYGAQAPAPVANQFDPAAYASGEKEKPPEQPKSLPTVTPSLTTFYYPSTPGDTRARGLSYRMEGGTQGGGRFGDIDLRNHTLEQFLAGKSDFVAVARKGEPTGEEFQMKIGATPIVGKWVDTGGGLRDGQTDIATSNPDLAKTGIQHGFDPASYADNKPQPIIQAGVPDINAFMEPAPTDTPEADTTKEPSTAEVVSGAISKAASKYGAALSNRTIPKFATQQYQPPAIPQAAAPQTQVIPGQGMIGASIPTAQVQPQPQAAAQPSAPTAQPLPTPPPGAVPQTAPVVQGTMEGLQQTAAGMVPHTMEQFKSLAQMMGAPQDREGFFLSALRQGLVTAKTAQDAIKAGPLSKEAGVAYGTIIPQALMMLGGLRGAGAVPSAGAVARSFTGANQFPHMQEVGAVGYTGERPVPEAFQPRGTTAENVPTNRPAPQLQEPQQFSVDMPADTFATEHAPVSSALHEMKVLSKSGAKRSGKYDRNPDLWDGAPQLAHPTHNKIYSAGGTMPDVAAQALHEAGLIADPYVDTMWNAVEQESKSSRSTMKSQRTDAKAIGQASKVQAGQTRAFNAAERAAWKGGQPAIPVKDLQVGDTVTVGGEKFKVTDIDPDTFDVTLEDGSKYGVQSVRDNTVIYGKHEGTGAKPAARPATTPPPAAATPPPRQPPPPPRQPPQGPPPQNPPPGGGIPPQPPKSVPVAMRLRAIRDRIASGKDSVFTTADYQARQKANGVRQDFGAQVTRSPNLKENVQANKDMEAATFIAEAQGNKIALAHDLEMVRNSKDAKLAKKYEPILKYAMDNFTRISDQLAKSRYTKLMADQLAEDQASGITYPEREGYVTHVLKNEPANAFVSFFTGKMGSGGLSRYFTKSREFGTLAEAINAGVDPASVNLADLAQHRIASSRRLILNKALFNELKNIQGPDGNPVLKGVFRHPDPPHGPIVPKGYELMNLNGVEVAVHPAYSGLFKSLYGDSALRRTALGRGTMRTAGVLKSYTLAADTYHGFRGIKKGLFYGGKGSRLGFKRGTTVYELSDEGLDTAVKNNEITKGQADWAKSARPAIEEMMKNGLNVSKYADNLVGQMHVNFPGTGRLNDLIFNRVFRGAMIQASHANYLRNLSRFPELTKQQVARRTAKEMNEVFGNMMSQGILKDKTLQDTANLVLLSPQWVESQVRAEFRGYGQMGNVIADAAKGKFRVGTVAQGQATAVLAYLVGNQIINYATTGHSTFENDGWTNKMSAFLPVGDRGVYLNPFALSAEYADRFLTIMDRQGEDSNVFSVLSEMAKSKLTGAANAVVTLATQRDWRGRRLDGSGDILLEAGKDVVPVPIGVKNVGGAFITSDPNASLGFSFEPQYDKITQGVLQAMGERGNLGPGTSQYPGVPVRVHTKATKRGVY